jgi:hypothetical protein
MVHINMVNVNKTQFTETAIRTGASILAVDATVDVVRSYLCKDISCMSVSAIGLVADIITISTASQLSLPPGQPRKHWYAITLPISAACKKFVHNCSQGKLGASHSCLFLQEVLRNEMKTTKFK